MTQEARPTGSEEATDPREVLATLRPQAYGNSDAPEDRATRSSSRCGPASGPSPRSMPGRDPGRRRGDPVPGMAAIVEALGESLQADGVVLDGFLTKQTAHAAARRRLARRDALAQAACRAATTIARSTPWRSRKMRSPHVRSPRRRRSASSPPTCCGSTTRRFSTSRCSNGGGSSSPSSPSRMSCGSARSSGRRSNSWVDVVALAWASPA